MHKRFFSFVLGVVLFFGNLFANSFDEYKQAFIDTNYNKIFSLYQENIHNESGEQYKEYLFNEISKAISTNTYHAHKLTNQFLLLEPNNNYGRYFQALLFYEEGDYNRAYELAKQLSEGYIELEISTKVNTLLDKLNKILYPSKQQKTIGLEKKNNQYFIEAKIDNQRVKLLIDTGATTTMINSSVAQRLYYQIISDSIDIQTASGITKAKRIEVQNLSINDLNFEKVEIIASRENVFNGFDGLLGMNILKYFQLDTKNNKLIFEH
ncbi:MAG: retropepsin-like aspartic protease [Arcobacteraceae bacterium]|nr:retropepsin-like aspartic protease [Arcobacteraceae bacterium]